MIIGRNEPLDYEVIFDTLVNVTADYVRKSGLQSMVLGISGGIDSTVCAIICSKVSEKINVPLCGVSLPCSTNKSDENDIARLVGEEFCDEFTVASIQEGFEAVEKMCKESSFMESTPISQGNIKARLRMIALYDLASKRKGIVIDTDNLTEHYLGFFTINGDVGDLNPIGNLWKTEVYGLAKWISQNIAKDSQGLKESIAITPTDGNGISNSDLDQIMPGYTYYDVDRILMPWVTLDERIKESYLKDGLNQKGTVFKKLVDEYGEDNVRRVILRCVRSEFKRFTHPTPIDMFRGKIEKEHYN
jgi:NAD+ synthetase